MLSLLKNILICALLGLAFSIAVRAQQASSCNLQLNPVSFVENTDTKPVEGAQVKLINAKNKKLSASPIDGYLFENLPNGDYRVTASGAGFRTSTDTINLNCALTSTGTFSYLVIMWEGDPGKTINFLKIDETGEKAEISGEYTTGPALVDSKGKQISAPVGKEKILRIGAAPGEKDQTQGVLNGSAQVLAKPKYPPTAVAVGAKGTVAVQVILDEEGYVVAAKAISGHPLLKSISALAAKASRFAPTLLSGVPVKVSGIIVYNFQ